MAKPLVVPFVTEGAYAATAGAPQETVFEAGRLTDPPPRMFPAQDRAFFGDGPLDETFPPVTVTTLQDVVVRGRSNVLAPIDANLRHDLIDLDREIMPETFYGRLRMADDQVAAAWGPDDPFGVGYVAEAATFVDGVSANYAHWLTEVLPRIAAFWRDPARRRTPLIIDAALHPNLERSLELVVGPGATIVRLKPEELLRVGTLYNVSPTAYAPFKVRPQPADLINQGRFSPPALRHAIERLRASVGGAQPSVARPKLVLRRKSTLRHITNEADIGAALVSRGFTAVDTDTLSLDEQVRLFGQAKMVVGATGAAMANLIFCPPDCPVVVMIPRFRETVVWYWRRMSAAAGAGPVFHVSGVQTTPLDDAFHPLAAHADFQVRVKDVLDAVEAAEAT